jgi:VanZ like family
MRQTAPFHGGRPRAIICSARSTAAKKAAAAALFVCGIFGGTASSNVVLALVISRRSWLAHVERSDLVALVVLAAAALACTSLARGRRYRTALLVWIGSIVGVSLPAFDFHTHAHWQSVAPIPFASAPIKLSDIVANLVLYMPLGYLARFSRLGLRDTTVLAAAASVCLELSQVFSHTRIASATDVACNTIGAILGFLAASWLTSAR